MKVLMYLMGGFSTLSPIPVLKLLYSVFSLESELFETNYIITK